MVGKRHVGPARGLPAGVLAVALILSSPFAAEEADRDRPSADRRRPPRGGAEGNSERPPWAPSGRRAAGLDQRAERAVQRGLAYLARHQSRDGSWSDRIGRKVYTAYRGKVGPHVGVTALAGIAFLSNGVLPHGGPGKYSDRYGRTVYGWQVVEKAIDYLLDHATPTGYITHEGSRMYSHAFAALFLSEAYGMGYHRGGRLRRALKRAIDMIVSSQNREGGWRYKPNAEDSDMSITVCQVMALRAARNAGIGVSKKTIDNAVLYVRRSFLPGIGAFTYQLGPAFRGIPSRHSFALTAAGVTTLYGAGEYSATRMLRQAVDYLWHNRPPRPRRGAPAHFDYYYGQYYAVQAMFQTGGERWRRWYDDYIKPDLLAVQEPENGSWTDLVGSNYATAMAIIILQFPNQYLPITEN